MASASLLDWCSFVRASLGEGLPKVHCKGKCMCTTFPLEQSGGEAFMQSAFMHTRTLEFLIACLKQAGVQACVGGQAFLEPCKPQRLSLPKIVRTIGTRN